MQKFYKYIYWDENIPEKKRNQIKWRVKVSFRKMKPVYLVTLCEGPDQLEIYYSSILLQNFYRKNPRMIIGIAATYNGAIEIIRQITEECFQENHNCDLKYYLSQRE